MRLLLLTAYFPPDTGSAPHLFHELGQTLARAGHDVTVVTTMPTYHVTNAAEAYSGTRFIHEHMDGMNVVRCSWQARPMQPGAGRGWWQLTTAFSLWWRARKLSRFDAALSRFDAALVLSPPLFLGVAAARLHVPFILNVQDLFPQSAIDLGVLKPGMITSLLRRVERYVYRRAAHITVHSEGNSSFIASVGIEVTRISVLPNWVDTTELRPGARDNAFARAHGLHDKFVVSFAGVLGISLGIEIIADSAAKLTSYPDIRFLIVGNGAAEASLRARVRELGVNNVIILPMVPKNTYPEILAASDVALVLLRPDVKTPVVPGKIGSIMASGRPIIAAVPADGDAAKLVRTADAGLVTPAGDPGALANAILKLRADLNLRERYGTHGREYAVNHLSLAHAVLEVEALLRRVAENRGTMR
jgi:colanic acid biosynthesis glycosyl transferase WcaI